MSTTTISLARLIALGVPRAWHEIVAVVLEAAHAMQVAGRTTDVSACVIDGSGAVRIEGGGSSGDIEGAVVALLGAMLEGQGAPAELRGLAAPAASGSGQGLDSLLKGLAYFERPDRRSTIAALASRALAAEARSQTEAEFARLRSGVNPQASPSREASPQGRRRAWIGLSTVLLLVAAGAAAALWYVNRPAAPAEMSPVTAGESTPAETGTPQSMARSIVTAAAEAIASVADAGLRAVGMSPSEPAPAETPSAPAAASRPTPRSPVKPLETSRRPAPLTPESAPAAAVPTGLPVLIAEPDESALPPAPPPGPYTEADADVEPPVLVYPQLPSEPQSAPPADVPHFELLVNERGEVDQVRLRATDARIEERMMVSAAKAWRFRPAMKDGKPVRYRVRVPIPR
ncbi:MAG: energy transducer TonB [Vicinamibacterales bacterium]